MGLDGQNKLNFESMSFSHYIRPVRTIDKQLCIKTENLLELQDIRQRTCSKILE
uniref:Uncharacterized protein n=1 Tax=Spironucleus salmonicida TaxID=348837 RepID=V6LR01_9EUKA|eukprot:EST47025.1 Hypothetical protein SS50377_12981 [Spironucleus salmonicida]